MNEALPAAFPDLSAELNEYVSWQDGMDTGAFMAFEDAFRPHVQKAIMDNDEAFLPRSSNFIEKLFVSGDENAVNVVTVGILEGLSELRS